MPDYCNRTWSGYIKFVAKTLHSCFHPLFVLQCARQQVVLCFWEQDNPQLVVWLSLIHNRCMTPWLKWPKNDCKFVHTAYLRTGWVHACSLWSSRGLTHWGRLTHVSVSKLTSIGSDYGLSPGLCKTIIWTNAGLLLIGILGTNFS